ncbi:MAG: hypothetical protein ACK5TR_02030 [Alphaproteobacteria bacterium]|jgi:hypothetical protein|nr:hypothetical protein [Alphaproteobacteria bacterium]
MKSIHYKLLITSLLMPLTATACPVLDLQTLPKAICADETTPITQTGGNMQYTSKNAADATCAKDAKSAEWRKSLQSLFKKAKDYNGQLTKSTPGVYACTYTLPDSWQKSLGTKVTTFTLLADIKQAVTSGIAKKSLCPDIDWDKFKSLEQGDTLSVRMAITAGGQTFDWKLEGKKIDSTWLGAKKPEGTGALTGVGSVRVPFTNECAYTYHKGSEEKKFTLVGKLVK